MSDDPDDPGVLAYLLEWQAERRAHDEVASKTSRKVSDAQHEQMKALLAQAAPNGGLENVRRLFVARGMMRDDD